MKVEYDPSTTTISCVFENESDLSEKLCSIRYGLCGKEANSVLNSTTEGSSFAITLKLSSIAMNSKYCYVVTAKLSNDTLTVMVKGNFETQSSINVSVIVGAVIIVIVGLVAGTVIIIVACFIIRRRRTEYGMLNLAITKSRCYFNPYLAITNQPNDDATQYAKEHDYELVKLYKIFQCIH